MAPQTRNFGRSLPVGMQPEPRIDSTLSGRRKAALAAGDQNSEIDVVYEDRSSGRLRLNASFENMRLESTTPWAFPATHSDRTRTEAALGQRYLLIASGLMLLG